MTSLYYSEFLLPLKDRQVAFIAMPYSELYAILSVPCDYLMFFYDLFDSCDITKRQSSWAIKYANFRKDLRFQIQYDILISFQNFNVLAHGPRLVDYAIALTTISPVFYGIEIRSSILECLLLNVCR